MGPTKTKRKDAGDKGAKRKRRRKARIQVSSSESSSSSSEGEGEAKVQKQGEGERDVEGGGEEAESKPTPVMQDSESDSEHELAPANFKNGRIPSPLRDLHDTQAAVKFEEYYMTQLTREFGDDLNSVREAKDFTDRSLPMLVRALRMGVDIFDEAEKQAIIKESTGGGGGGGSGSGED